jgi:hypothetical protein
MSNGEGKTVQAFDPSPNETYSKLIAEAYLRPIRSVIMVDDEFPSLDELLKGVIEKERPWGGRIQDAETVRDVLKFSREKKLPWLVDVHDGKEVSLDGELKIAPHLHHSDLMILDYHLVQNDASGDKAIKILRNLSSSDHFNLVIIYTKGYTGEDFRRVWEEVSISLVSRDHVFCESVEAAKVKAAVSEWEETDDKVLSKLLAPITNDTYFNERFLPAWQKSWVERRAVDELVRSLPRLRGEAINTTNLFLWLLDQHHLSLRGQMAERAGKVTREFSEAVNWIRTDRIFVTVVSKRIRPSELEERLLTALVASRPTPYQLLLSRMRAEVDERGGVAEAEILNDEYMQAGWLSELFKVDSFDKKRLLASTVSRNWESLADRLSSNIEEFTSRLTESVVKRGESDVFKAYFPRAVRDAKDKSTSYANCFISTKPVDRSHLTTGHVYSMPTSGGGANLEYWVCLSPACDLIPGQKTKGWYERLGNVMPFLAVQLQSVKLGNALERVNDNVSLFIHTGKEVETFSVCPDGDPRVNPYWEQMFAGELGKFGSPSPSTFEVHRIAKVEGTLRLESRTATVVAQLRYEYALNLAQRLTSVLSRIGLSFRGKDQ